MDESADLPALPPPAWHDRFQLRSHLLFFAVCLWAAIILIRLFLIMVAQRDTYLAQYEPATWRTGVIPALRGRLLDRDGRVLAWSERLPVVRYQVPEAAADLRRELETIAPALGLNPERTAIGLAAQRGYAVILLDRPTPEQLNAVTQLQHPHLTVGTTFVRHRAPMSASLLRAVGETTLTDGIEAGTSGWELAFDEALRGQDCRYKVMVDKRGNWIPETWLLLSPLRPGSDVTAPTVNPQRSR